MLSRTYLVEEETSGSGTATSGASLTFFSDTSSVVFFSPSLSAVTFLALLASGFFSVSSYSSSFSSATVAAAFRPLFLGATSVAALSFFSGSSSASLFAPFPLFLLGSVFSTSVTVTDFFRDFRHLLGAAFRACSTTATFTAQSSWSTPPSASSAFK